MERRNTAEQINTVRKNKSYIIIAVEVLLLVVLVCVLWLVTKFTDEEKGMQRIDIAESDVTINEGAKTDNINQDASDDVLTAEKGPTYRNIALFGLDSTTGELTKGTRSDTIMIASINNATKEVRLMSVYRDTYLNLGNDTYNKCNTAYAKGGAKQAISMLNMNLDLDITDFVAVGFKGVMDTVNAIGGIYIDIDSGELQHINNYQISISENLQVSYTPITETGYQLVDGLQAVAYCRIRQVGNNDFKRTERQREVLQAILDETRELDVKKVAKLANSVFADFYTSVDLEEIITLLSDVASYELIDEGGFPGEEYRTCANLGKNVGDSVICTDLETAVAEFHERFFGQTDYQVSKALVEISDQIGVNIAPYLQN